MHIAAVSRSLGCLTLALALTQAPAHALPRQESEEDVFVAHAALPGRPERLAPIVFYDVRLREMVAELQRLSPTAAAMLRKIQESGFPLAFGNFSDVAEEMEHEYSSWDPERRTAAGFMAPVVREVERFSRDLTTVKILVAVNLNMLDGIFEGAEAVVDESVSWAEIQRLETLAVLAHELVHAYGLALSGGDPRLGCHDPVPEERPADSCVMVGENLVRKEIGAPLDWDYGFHTLDGLAKRYAAFQERRALVREMADIQWPAIVMEPLSRPIPARSPIGLEAPLPRPLPSVPIQP
jgi:hypothetical protein